MLTHGAFNGFDDGCRRYITAGRGRRRCGNFRSDRRLSKTLHQRRHQGGNAHQDDQEDKHDPHANQHELEALRHELAMLRAEMGGRGGRYLQRDSGRFPGQMQLREMRLPRMQFRMAPGAHGEHGMFPDMELHSLDLEGLHELHGLDLGDLHERIGELHGDLGQEIRIERHESSENGAKVESRIKVIINGEVYEGDEARAKLEELGHEMPELPKMEMRMRAMPTPPTPPTPPAPQPNRWRRSGGEDHEDL